MALHHERCLSGAVVGALSLVRHDTADANVTVAYRPIDQLDSKRLTMSADDKLIVAAFDENGLNDDSDRNKVVGEGAYDELVRIP